jgi:hypothetical protein
MQGAEPNPDYAALPSSALDSHPLYAALPDTAVGASGALAAFQQGMQIKQGTPAWHAARAAVPFTAAQIGVQLGFHGSKAAKVLEGSATVRSGGSGDAAAAYKRFYQPSQQQSAGLAMLWGSRHEVCGKITLLSSLYPGSHLSECGFQATPAAALKGLLPFGMLGASPDGMLLHDMKLTAVEIKCPFPFQPNDKHGFRYVVLPFYCMSTQQRSNV